MKKLVLSVLAAAATFGAVGTASAQGFYFGSQPRVYYEEPRAQYYGPHPIYRDDYGPRYRRGGRDFYVDREGKMICKDRRFTVQDGICKPYRGY